MVVDTSAIMAILLGEDGRKAIVEHIYAAESAVMPATVVVELGIQLDKMTETERSAAQDTLDILDVTVAAIEPAVAQIARDAHAKFGRYSGSKARLNFGDCFSYALAKSRGEPLLFKGNDFTHTDILAA